jgi:hypothetical protein
VLMPATSLKVWRVQKISPSDAESRLLAYR